jgi:hypothetical protein
MNPHADSVQQPSDEQCYAVPLVELLKRVPQDARLVIEWPPEQGIGTSFIPVGRYCHEAAEALARFGTRPAAEPVSEIVKLQIEVDEASRAGEADPLQGAADWLKSAIVGVTVGDLQQNLLIGYNRAKRLFDAALSRQAPAAPAEAVTRVPPPYCETLAECADDMARESSAPTPSDPQALLGWTRYEKARKLNVAQWAELHQRNLKGENFDDMIDALPATTQPVQQDTRSPMQTWWFKELQEFWESSDSYITAAIKSAMDHIRTTPPAEKQAAPSGEDNHG